MGAQQREGGERGFLRGYRSGALLSTKWSITCSLADSGLIFFVVVRFILGLSPTLLFQSDEGFD